MEWVIEKNCIQHFLYVVHKSFVLKTFFHFQEYCGLEEFSSLPVRHLLALLLGLFCQASLKTSSSFLIVAEQVLPVI